MEPISLRTPLALLLISLGAIAAAWWWMATPIVLSRAPIDPAAKLLCVSYAPFRGAQTPLVPTTRITPEQIAQDLAQLAKISDCVRTYSIENGLDQVPALAAKVGLKVMQGIWLGSDRFKNLAQISTVISLTRQYPDVITSVVVGNEVLLRGEMTTADLAATIRSVKAQVSVPVTYPGKEILIGETGWPSEGRMRAGALPSRTNQARVVSEILSMAKQENFRVNLIEAYDQPWKRQLEGTVGGYWGLIDSVQRMLKYPPGEAISNFPLWKWQMGGGMALAVLVFGAGWLTLRRRPWTPRLSSWIAVALSATSAGILLGLAADKMVYESYGFGGWLCWGTLLAMGVLSPLLCTNALMSGRALPTFIEWLGPRDLRTGSVMSTLLAVVLAVTTLIAAETALGFVFDPRYKDFPFAALTMAVLPFAMVALLNRPAQGTRPIAEASFAGLLAASVIYIGCNEGPDNWQSLWTCAMYLLLAFTLWQARGVQTPK